MRLPLGCALAWILVGAGPLLAEAPSNLTALIAQPVEARILSEKALDQARHAVKLDPNSAKAHLAMALCYGKLTDFVGNKQKLEYSKLIRDETLRSLELDPNDDHAWHVLGRWHAGIAGVNGMLKVMAKLVYGALPEASFEQAIKSLQRAIELAPNRIMHHSELARIFTEADKPAQAAAEWQKVLKLPPTERADPTDQNEARAALKKR
jgi:tetratricopeptide (TPR) repeat protein